MASADQVTVASGLEAAFAPLLAQAVPEARVVASPVDRPWDIAPEARMVVVEPRGCWAGAPATRPESWANVTCIQSVSAGMDAFPDWVRDIPSIACARGLTSAPIAEYTLCAMLSHARAFNRNRLSAPEDWRTDGIATLQGKTLGLAGYGAIGQEVARLARAFGMEIVVHRRSAAAAGEAIEVVPDLAALAARADHLVVALPLTPATRGAVDADVLAAARPGAHVINVSRGAVLDLDALRGALDAGKVAFATLDVTDPEPLPAGHWAYGDPRIHLTPHMSWRGDPDVMAQRDRMVIGNVRRFLAGEPLHNTYSRAAGY